MSWNANTIRSAKHASTGRFTFPPCSCSSPWSQLDQAKRRLLLPIRECAAGQRGPAVRLLV